MCTLTTTDRQARLESIRNLTSAALRGHSRDDLKLTLRYAPEAAARVRAIVADERQCCAFLAFTVSEQPDATIVTITAPEHARDAADELLEHFASACGVDQ